jgi:hypothetical protein
LGYSASYWAQWSDRFKTRLEARRGFHGSARAMADNIRENYYRGTAHYGERDEWGLRATGDYADLSDQNNLSGAEFEAGLPFGKRTSSIGPVYRFLYDNSKRPDERYYTPNDLRVHSFGGQYVLAAKSAFKLQMHYLPGIATEKNKNQKFAQSAEISVLWTATSDITLTPAFIYEEQGSYFYNMSSLEMELRF